MSESCRVEILARTETTVELKLDLNPALAAVSLGPSFARMLVEDHDAPGHSKFKRWLRARYAENGGFSVEDSIAKVTVLSTSRPKAAQGDASEEASPAAPTPVVLEIVSSQPGLFDHFAVGHAWLSSAGEDGKAPGGKQ